ARHNLDGEIGHQSEPGHYPAQLQPENRVGESLPECCLHDASGRIKRAEMIRHSSPLMSPRTTRRDTVKRGVHPRLIAQPEAACEDCPPAIPNKTTSGQTPTLKRAPQT